MPRLTEANIAPLEVRSSKRLSGIFAQMGVFNQNERRYPEDIYMEAYEELKPKIDARRLLGELDHPIDYDEVRLSNVSHVITECHVAMHNGVKTVYGTVELLDTPAGRIAQALVRAGIQLGISSRGVGNTKKVSEGVDVTQLKLITYDLVADPSFKNAILSESKRAELQESLDRIESKLPLNESKENDMIRSKIHKIRESLCCDNSTVESNITRETVQNLEIESLRKVLESKKSIIEQDTLLLKRQRSELATLSRQVRKLKESLEDWKSRYTSIRENNMNLQDEFNKLTENINEEKSNEIRKKDAEILELTKRLAVEKRGMSYSRVENLLEGLTTLEEIDQRLDSVSSMNRGSSILDEDLIASLRESSSVVDNSSRLSRIVSRI